MTVPVEVVRLGRADLKQMHAMLDLFAEVFGEPDTYTAARPGDAYCAELLDNSGFVALVATDGPEIVGALTAYELPKYEQPRSEFYIYDLAVRRDRRRRGIATALIRRLTAIAAGRAAHIVFVQADQGDAPAIALYEKLGRREDIHHFDIAVPRTR